MPNEQGEGESTENVCIRIMRESYPNGVERKVLTTRLVDEMNVNRAYARVKIARAVAKGQLREMGGCIYLR